MHRAVREPVGTVGGMTLSVCVAGATGWTGRAVAEAVLAADDVQLRSAVSRSAAGQDLGEAWGGQSHGVPVPSFVVSTEVVFALSDERLIIRHDAGSTPTPYVTGTLLAVRAAAQQTGLVRGLDTLLLDALLLDQ